MTNKPPRFLMVCAAALMALCCNARAGDAITTSTDPNGHKVFINASDSPHSRTLDRASTEPRLEGSGQEVRYVYWSNTQHRWKPVPGQSVMARRARTAAFEALVASTSGTPQPEATSAGNGQVNSGDRQTSNDVANFFTPAKLNEAIEQAAQRHNVDPDLVRAVIKVESNFNPHAVSRKGAMGLMQLMPETARSLRVAHPFDPNENVDAGVRHLRQLLDNYGGDLAMSLAAYNAGAGAVAQHNGVPPYRETQNYVRQITALYKNGGLMGAPVRHPIHVSKDAEGHLLFSNTD
jgi:hypothetical protein